MVLPKVVGYKITGEPDTWVTSTDVVLTITKHLRQVGVVGKFVEFFGPGVEKLSIADRATIANMCPECGVHHSIPEGRRHVQRLQQRKPGPRVFRGASSRLGHGCAKSLRAQASPRQSAFGGDERGFQSLPRCSCWLQGLCHSRGQEGHYYSISVRRSRILAEAWFGAYCGHHELYQYLQSKCDVGSRPPGQKSSGDGLKGGALHQN